MEKCTGMITAVDCGIHFKKECKLYTARNDGRDKQ